MTPEAHVQFELTAAGYPCGAIDGVYGPKTMGALASFTVGKQLPDAVGAALWPAMRRQDILTPDRIANFLANCGWESRFQPIEENLTYSAKRLTQVWPSRFKTQAAAQPYANNPRALANFVYGGRMGNYLTDDGWRYRGRGWPQLTGREAYAVVGGLAGQPFLSDPDLLLTYQGSAAAAAGFWAWRNLGPLADIGLVDEVRRRWNGGTHGLAEVRGITARLKGLWA